ncbi:MAG: hypothetical protein NT116_03350 [Candidatus Parcubacteria bacterium]|nr:hypothetical protein [Candidatus Parcubacteria bacterium]
MKNNYNKFFRIGIFILAGLTFMSFLGRDIVLSGKLEFKTDFKKFTPFISILKPQDRVVLNDMAFIQQEPVWFDIYLPRDFEAARLDFTYKNDYNYKIEVGPKIYEDNNPLQILDDRIDTLAPANIFKTKSLDFDLTNLPIRYGRLRFMISAPELVDKNKGIEIKELKVSLSRKSLWQEGLMSNITNYFNYFKNEFR